MIVRIVLICGLMSCEARWRLLTSAPGQFVAIASSSARKSSTVLPILGDHGGLLLDLGAEKQPTGRDVQNDGVEVVKRAVLILRQHYLEHFDANGIQLSTFSGPPRCVFAISMKIRRSSGMVAVTSGTASPATTL